MIAFDLDGVFVSDLAHTTEQELERVLAVRAENIRPFFRLRFPFYIITARPKIDEAHTLRWIDAVFEPDERPEKLFHDNPDFEKPVDYKTSVLMQHPEITTFVESEIDQVTAIAKLVPDCRVLHFEELVTSVFETLAERALSIKQPTPGEFS